MSNNDILNLFSRETSPLPNRSHRHGIFMDNCLAIFPPNFFPLECRESWKWTNREAPVFSFDPHDVRWVPATLGEGMPFTGFTTEWVTSVEPPTAQTSVSSCEKMEDHRALLQGNQGKWLLPWQSSSSAWSQDLSAGHHAPPRGHGPPLDFRHPGRELPLVNSSSSIFKPSTILEISPVTYINNPIAPGLQGLSPPSVTFPTQNGSPCLLLPSPHPSKEGRNFLSTEKTGILKNLLQKFNDSWETS